jgi:hypothetical protein
VSSSIAGFDINNVEISGSSLNISYVWQTLVKGGEWTNIYVSSIVEHAVMKYNYDVILNNSVVRIFTP